MLEADHARRGDDTKAAVLGHLMPLRECAATVMWKYETPRTAVQESIAQQAPVMSYASLPPSDAAELQELLQDTETECLHSPPTDVPTALLLRRRRHT